MPLIKIHMRDGKPKEHKRTVLDGVHAALVSVFKIPANDRIILLSEYDAEHFDGRDENFTIVEILAYSGRTKDMKRDLFKKIVENVCKGTKLVPTDIFIVLNDIPKDNWGIRGGLMASELDLGMNPPGK
jgi:phenylpyruvate tautomerase PptA (4-oxalocrotonate tautomerase family)